MPIRPLVGLFALALGCGSLRPAPSPLRVVRAGPTPADARCTIVLLPGRFDRPEEFVEAGFGEALAAAGVRAEALAADVHLGYYARRTALERIHADLVAPARAAGRDRIWLVGISMGGLGALLYPRDFPGEVDGVVALSPYLGEPATVAGVAAAGGLASWRPPVDSADGPGVEVWTWLQASARAGFREPAIVLGFGTRDALAPGHRALAAELPAERVLERPGGHDWRTWRRLWDGVLASGPLRRACGDAPADEP
jgi:pimeloyl-ACP methyl ester carboxylesterase